MLLRHSLYGLPKVQKAFMLFYFREIIFCRSPNALTPRCAWFILLWHRHTRYQTQYRAQTALNCRIKQEEILRYTEESSMTVDNGDQLPFEKRLNVVTPQVIASGAQMLASRLQKDEFYPVVCSDCSTMVGVYDRDQNYYFFNVLPSNC